MQEHGDALESAIQKSASCQREAPELFLYKSCCERFHKIHRKYLQWVPSSLREEASNKWLYLQIFSKRLLWRVSGKRLFLRVSTAATNKTLKYSLGFKHIPLTTRKIAMTNCENALSDTTWKAKFFNFLSKCKQIRSFCA